MAAFIPEERMETLAENNINVVVFSNNLLRYAHFVESEPYLGGNLYAPSLNEFRSAARLARDNNMIILYNFRFSDCVTALFGH